MKEMARRVIATIPTFSGSLLHGGVVRLAVLELGLVLVLLLHPLLAPHRVRVSAVPVVALDPLGRVNPRRRDEAQH